MKTVYKILTIAFFLFFSERSFSQSFTVAFPDTVAYGDPVAGAALSCWVGDYVTNHSGASIVIDIVRVQDDNATPGWTSAFCFNACQMPSIDSMRSTLADNDSVNMAVHLIVTATPDSGTVIMKLKNVSNPSNVIYQRFHGVSRLASGVNEGSNAKASVNIYPSPIMAGNNFSMNIANPKNKGNEIVLEVYNMFGSIVYKENDLKEGKNTLRLDLPTGIYSYSLGNGSAKFTFGKLVVSR